MHRFTAGAMRIAACTAVLTVLSPFARTVETQVAIGRSDSASRSPADLSIRMIDMGGYRLRVRKGGSTVPGRPTVVFESGLGTPLETWTTVQRDLAGDAATFAYDRAGLGGSDARPEAPTLDGIVAALHEVLVRTGTQAPYVLVGHSMGGPVVRLFAARYPGEVAGLVYVDPSDFTLSVAAQDSLWSEIGIPGGRAAFNAWSSSQGGPAGVRREVEMFAREFTAGFPSFRALPAAPQVPIVVLLAGQLPPAQPGAAAFPGGPAVEKAFFAAWTRQRVAHMTRWARAGEPGAEGTLVLTPNSSHYIQATEPELVSWGVRRALFPDVAARLDRAIADGGADSALALHAALRRRYPPAAFNERILNAVGYALLQRGDVAGAVRVFERNVAEYPAASNPHDSLGEAYMAQGDRARAIASYERSLALDPLNANAVAQLRKLRGP